LDDNVHLTAAPPRPIPAVREFKSKLKYWAIDRVEEAYWNIEQKMKGDTIRVYRVITAPPDWTPGDRHLGIYWSWDEHAAEAHWGEFGTGHVKWRLIADVTSRQIDWVSTLAANGSPDLENEKEITLRENVHK
jgi:hypothetical protein